MKVRISYRSSSVRVYFFLRCDRAGKLRKFSCTMPFAAAPRSAALDDRFSVAPGADLHSVLTESCCHFFAGVVRSFFQQFGPVVEVRKPYGILCHLRDNNTSTRGRGLFFPVLFRSIRPFHTSCPTSLAQELL